MRNLSARFGWLVVVCAGSLPATDPDAPGSAPIALHPQNPRYFLFRGQPTVLISSAEHYGAVLNLDFDYLPYLDELKAHGFNQTRCFSGTYREIPESFSIRGNTLAPLPGRYLAPWARSDEPGYFDGSKKIDLSRFSDEYFRRLHDYLARAGERGVVVEYVLFCPLYEEQLWTANAMNAANTVNGVGKVPRDQVYTLENKELLEVQTAFVRKAVSELRDVDNVYYEICNEPYFGGVTLEWQRHIARVIEETERGFPHRHLIAQNIANGSAKVTDPTPGVSILNFHYANPPITVALNDGLRRAIIFDESGFRGPNDVPYRTEAWEFLLAGGSGYSNLDYSFTPTTEDGTAVPNAPGGGGLALRRQLASLKRFIESFDFVRLAPDPAVIAAGLPSGLNAYALAERGKAYALYFDNEGFTGPFSVRWTGTLEPRFTETYKVFTVSNDGVRLWIDDKLVIDDWNDHAAKEDSAEVALVAGKRHAVKMEFYQNGGDATAKLSWSSASQAKETIPAERLRPASGEGSGLLGEYFTGKDLGNRKMSRVDAGVDFAWKETSPFRPQGAKARTRLTLELAVPAGKYRAEWINPLTGAIDASEEQSAAGDRLRIASPEFDVDIALRVKRQGD